MASPYPDFIDKNTKEIRQDEEGTVYKTLEEIGDDLPDHSPRFVLLSYPLTLVRTANPLILREKRRELEKWMKQSKTGKEKVFGY